MEKLIETIEAIIFAAGRAIKRKEIKENLPEDVTNKEFNAAIEQLIKKYSGDSGILLLSPNDLLQFCSNEKYGTIVAAALQPVKERVLSGSLLEVIAIVAYCQPVTRSDIEQMRGASCDYQVSALQAHNLIEVTGHKDSPGRPALFGTTDEFLKKFQLNNIAELPDSTEVFNRLKASIDAGYTDNIGADLFSTKKVTGMLENAATPDFLDHFIDTNEIPDFLADVDDDDLKKF